MKVYQFFKMAHQNCFWIARNLNRDIANDIFLTFVSFSEQKLRNSDDVIMCTKTTALMCHDMSLFDEKFAELVIK
jgi:hypothetical protein